VNYLHTTSPKRKFTIKASGKKDNLTEKVKYFSKMELISRVISTWDRFIVKMGY